MKTKLWFDFSFCATGFLGLQFVSFSGANTYDPLTCALTVAAVATGEIGSGTVLDMSSSELAGKSAVYTLTHVNVSNTQRQQQSDNGLGGYTCAGGRDPQGDLAYTVLSDEDTENDAIKRSSTSYPPFTEAAIGGCCSFIGTRNTVDLSFSFADSKLQVTVTGWGKVKVKVHYNRGLIGGALSYYGFEEHDLTLTPNISTQASQVFTTLVPNQYGYQTCWAYTEVIPGDP